MPLVQQQVDTFVSLTLRRVPDVLAIRVYGSRRDDKRRGGDVDLMIETDFSGESGAIIARLRTRH